MDTKLRSCAFCGDMFDSKWITTRKHYADYCPKCVKDKVWWKKSRPFLGYKKISDEGVVLYENS